MSTIRPLERADLPAVIALMRPNFESFSRDRSFVEGTLADDPWAPDPLPALVSEDGGEIVGFIGAQARRMTFDGNEVRGVSVSQFVVAPERRGGGAALGLLRHLFSGPQELTWAEDSPENVARMWGVLGGGVDHSRTCDWMLILRPVRWLGRIIPRAPREGFPKHTVPVPALPTGALRTRRRVKQASVADIVGHDASAAEAAAELPALTRRIRLRADYDEQHLDHKLKHWSSVAGDLVSRLVRRRGRTVGWYVYIPRPGGRAVCCTPRPWSVSRMPCSRT